MSLGFDKGRKSAMACRLCRAKTAEMSSVVSLKSVDESKLQSWACQNLGKRINLDDAGAPALACWTCIHSARKLANCFGSAGQDWWAGLEDPDGTPEDDSEDDDSGKEEEDVHVQQENTELVLRPCFVLLNPLSVKLLTEKVKCSVKLQRISAEQVESGISENAKPKSDPLIFECTICSKPFQLRISLKRHLKDMHWDEMIRCKFCSSKFENREFLQIHCNYYHQEDMEVAQLKLTCNYCNELMGSNLKLQQHITLHHPNLRFQCDDCHQWFPTLLSQRLHIKRQHSG